MPVPHSPPWTRGSASRRQASYDSYAHPGLRISDAERAEVADRLSRHYGDGRLDQAEFDQRLDQAMRAKTQADLDGLFADLPPAEPSGPPARKRREPRPGHPFLRILAFALLIVVAIVTAHALLQSFIPWLLIGLIVFWWLRRGPGQYHRPD
jgi:hypothetical protein